MITVLYILGAVLLPLLIYVSFSARRSRYKYAEQFARDITGLTYYDGKVMKYQDGFLFVIFRIEEEKKTVIQRCEVVRKFKKDQPVGIYFYENGPYVRAVPASGTVCEREYIKLTLIHMLTAWAAITDIILMILGIVL